MDGKLRDYEEFLQIKAALKSKIENAALTLYFINASSIDAYILGLILKFAERDKIKINIIVGSARLYEFLKGVEFGRFFDIKIKEFRA